MLKSLTSSLILSFTQMGLLDAARGIETMGTFVDDIPKLAGIPDALYDGVGTQFPLTEEDTIKLQNRFALILMQKQREQEKRSERKERSKREHKEAAAERKAVPLSQPALLDRFTFYKQIFGPAQNGVPVEEQTSWYVAFIDPDCPFSQRLEPTWTSLHQKYSLSGDLTQSRYRIAVVNCASPYGAQICKDLGIQSTPTALFFPAREQNEQIYCDTHGQWDPQLSPVANYEALMTGLWQDTECKEVPKFMLPGRKSKQTKSKKRQKEKLTEKKIRRAERQQAERISQEECADDGAQVHPEL